ncbi:uncharacterized protein CTRU02_206114 [Colletotrichum truncatum]|uniref:Uncharacterized protein n=1 Tax=Colletotrichum truncatum TaxID=5467 RepID=A0ACC3Z5Y7_COLTU|nr:uncharacterized protein CTRU02_10473 [Colletotrichum truncatum]KAF6787210.1 hypothetical protein CTRU02_10473 [Colletotrichum truncatum]
MPFDAEAYDLKCRQMDDNALIARREHYVRQIASSSTGAALRTAAGAATAGLTWLMIPYDAARIHNARRKRKILEKHAIDRGLTIETKCGDVLGPMALGATLGVVAFEGAQMCADMVMGADGGGSAAESKEAGEAVKGIAHLGLDAGIAAVEHKHAQREKSHETGREWKDGRRRVSLDEKPGEK